MKKFKTLLATALLATATSTLVYANSIEQQFQQGFEATKKGNYQTAFELWKPLAEQGDAKAQLNLGVMYERGLGVKQDDHQAFKWFQKAAEQGDATAQVGLGVRYQYGGGVRQDKMKAKYYYGLACDNGEQLGCDNYRRLNK